MPKQFEFEVYFYLHKTLRALGVLSLRRQLSSLLDGAKVYKYKGEAETTGVLPRAPTQLARMKPHETLARGKFSLREFF
jgi:hypothetical protein